MSDKSNSKFPEKADVVIVGVGGIVGSMLAYWLAELGQKKYCRIRKINNNPLRYCINCSRIRFCLQHNT